LEVLASRYPDDKPAISWREAKKFGVDWNERLFTAVENLSRVLLAIVFPLLLWISVAFIRRKFFLAGCGLWTVWVILLFAVCLRTPPFQQPDEPQHF
jgi:hypothetical protein